MTDGQEVKRKDFVNIIVAAFTVLVGVIVGIPAIGYLISPAKKVSQDEAWIPLGPLDSYPLDLPKLFSYTRTKITGWEKTVSSFGAYVWRFGSGESDVVVYSNMCTHLSCRVTWKDEIDVYLCPCHDGRFNKDGEVVAGPPPQPLYQYEAKVEEGTLFIKHMDI